MFTLERLRKAHKNLAMRVIAVDSRVPILFGNQRVSHIDLMALPDMVTEPLQIVDDTDPNFGQFPYMADYDAADTFVVD
jgi:hypothetical protein